MTENATSKRDTKTAVMLLLATTYLVSYLTRINFGAVISEIESATAFSKQQLGLAVTGSFITYGAGQILSGILGDRLLPKKLVFWGLCATVLMNAILPFCKTPWQMTVVWSINGLAQAFMWPPIVRLMVALFSGLEYNRATMWVMWGCSIGTIIIYLVSPLIISLSSWRGVFFFSAACGVIMAAFWWRFCPAVSSKKHLKTDTSEQSSIKIITPAFCFIMLSISLMGMLRDGVTTWTPSLISESFNLKNSVGILTGAILPIFGMLCYRVAMWLYTFKFKNPVSCAGIIFLIGMVSSILLYVLLDKSPVGSTLMLAVLNGSMHGVNLMLISMLPAFYAKTGKVSTISGVVNAFVYIGSASSTYGVAVLTESFGWNTTILIWVSLAFLGSAICFLCARPWKKSV